MRTSPLYSARERIAIEYAEGMGTDPQGIAQDEDFWRRCKAAFSDREIVDLSFCIACWMGLGRIGHVLGPGRGLRDRYVHAGRAYGDGTG